MTISVSNLVYVVEAYVRIKMKSKTLQHTLGGLEGGRRDAYPRCNKLVGCAYALCSPWGITDFFKN